MKNTILIICVFIVVFLSIWTAISVYNKRGARVLFLLIDAAAITAVIAHCLGVW